MATSDQEQLSNQQAPAVTDRRGFLTRLSQAALAAFVAGAITACGEMDDDDDDDDD